MSQRYPVPAPPGTLIPAYVPVITYFGGAYGDDLAVSTANVTNDFAPKTQVEKAALVGMPIAQDITTPRGWIDPQEPYGPPPVSPADDPTITGLAPNTGATGGSPIWVTITGTKFTVWSSVETGGVVTPYSRFISATKMAVLLDPRSSPGIINIKVIDHGVKSNSSDFTFT